MVILFGIMAGCSTMNKFSTDTHNFTVSDWKASGVLKDSINLITYKKDSLTNSASSDFYVEGASAKYDVNSVYLTYTVSEDIPRTGREKTTAICILYYPKTTDAIKGLIIYNPGTGFINTNIKDSKNYHDYEDSFKAYASHGYAIIYNYYIGLEPDTNISGVDSGDRHQRYSIMDSMEIQTTALLHAFVDYAVTTNLSMPDKKLFLMGHSIGGQYAAGYHLYYQTLPERDFNLTATFAGSGAYDLKKYYDDALLVYDRAASSTGNVRFMHLAVSLPVVLYEWENYYGGLASASDFMNFAGINFTNSDDDFTFIAKIKNHIAFSTTTNVVFSFSTDTQDKVINKTKTFTNGTNLYDFLGRKSVINRYTSNRIPIRAGYMPNDWQTDPGIINKKLSEKFSHITLHNFADYYSTGIFADQDHDAAEWALTRSALRYFDGY